MESSIFLLLNCYIILDNVCLMSIFFLVRQFYVGSTEIVDLLVQHGATVDTQDVHKNTPLVVAVSYNHVDTVRRLIELGARPDLDHCPLFKTQVSCPSSTYRQTYLDKLGDRIVGFCLFLSFSDRKREEKCVCV